MIATAVGLGPTLIVPGHNGFLAPPGDPAALAENVRECLRDPATRRAVGARARAAVLPRYSWNALADRLLELYAQAGIRTDATPRTS